MESGNSAFTPRPEPNSPQPLSTQRGVSLYNGIMKRFGVFCLWLGLLASACTPATPAPATPPPTPVSVLPATATLSAPPTPLPTATPSPTPQPRRMAQPSGPDVENFPAGVNPLTGRMVSDPATLKLPAMLISISNSPVTARPQAGPAFADWIFELFIGTGTTRFLGVFNGEYPRAVPNVSGECAIPSEITSPQGAWLGNRIWLDENGNNRQDDWEEGVGGICVELQEAATGRVLANTVSDTNGYFALGIPEKSPSLILQLQTPAEYDLVTPNLGDDDHDSDFDPLTGQAIPTRLDATWDAGLRLKVAPPAGEGRVQPIRSGRLTYATINKMFPFSCLAFAGAGDGIFERLDACRVVYGTDADEVNDGLLTTSEMRSLAAGNLTAQPINYSGHRFDPSAPAGGEPAATLQVFYHTFNQAAWRYDPVSGTYLRWTDFQDGSGRLTPALDALTGRQLAFENVIVVYARHDIFRHLQYDINLRPGQEGYAFLFRDGQVYKIRWSTGNREWEQKTGLIRPIHFLGTDKQPFPLKPGRTFLHLMTEYSVVEKLETEAWRAFFVVPNDLAPTPEK